MEPVHYLFCEAGPDGAATKRVRDVGSAASSAPASESSAKRKAAITAPAGHRRIEAAAAAGDGRHSGPAAPAAAASIAAYIANGGVFVLPAAMPAPAPALLQQ